ncbi:MAG TPA: FtsX-like permease family protein [Thiobacillaceae bacterium]|nr:FtsX-like permease family protein [Thiobacillaceae bacterium]
MRRQLADLLIALRNLTRNRRRSLAALFIIAAGVVSMVLAEGFIQWIFWAMREGTIKFQSGHVQVVRPGYFSEGVADPLAFLLPRDSRVTAALESTPGVKLVAPRLKVTGLISHGETTASFLAEGVIPGKEQALSEALHIVEGRNLASAEAPEVIVGRGLARSMGVGPGDVVALLTTASGSGINAVEATVVGIFTSTNQAYDDSALRLPLAQAETLLRVQGAHLWLVLLEETEQTDHFLSLFRTRFPQDDGPLEFVPWYAHADFYNKTVALFSQQIGVLRLIIGLIIVLSISNMLIMNVMERTGEVGTLLAIGFRRRKILQMFATEGLLLGLFGGLAGVVLGVALAALISAIGIPMPPPPGMERGFTGEIRVTAGLLLAAFLIAAVTTMLAGLYPAWKGSRQQIVNALRHNI